VKTGRSHSAISVTGPFAFADKSLLVQVERLGLCIRTTICLDSSKVSQNEACVIIGIGE
jgi:hypothetical protein